MRPLAFKMYSALGAAYVDDNGMDHGLLRKNHVENQEYGLITDNLVIR